MSTRPAPCAAERLLVLREWRLAVAVVVAVTIGLFLALVVRLTVFPLVAQHHHTKLTLPDNRPAAAGSRRSAAS